jgi:hypothetical protein
MVPRDKPHDRRVLIWSPTSLAFGNEVDYDEEGFGRLWDLALAYVRFDMFNPTNSPPVKRQNLGDEFAYSISNTSEYWLQPAGSSAPRTPSRDMSQEEGMVPISEYPRTDVALEGRHLPIGDSSHTGEFMTTAGAQLTFPEAEISNPHWPEVEKTRSKTSQTEHLPVPRPGAGGSSSNGDMTNLDNPGKHADLIKALLKAGNGQVGVWVDFEAVRKLVGNNTTVKALGFPSYTSMVKEAHDQNVIERRSNGNDSYSIRLLPTSSAQKPRNTPLNSRVSLNHLTFAPHC